MVDLALLLDAETTSYCGDEPTLRLRASVVRLTDDGIRNISYDSVERSGLADLTVSALGEPSVQHTYAWQVGYQQPYAVDLDRARVMAATLGRIERRLVQVSSRFGRAESFGAYVLRVAAALKVRRFVVWPRDPHGRRLRGEHRVLDAPAATAWLEAREREFHDAYPAATPTPA